jgi:predicted negative regulator of RcsB-dependent stress response
MPGAVARPGTGSSGPSDHEDAFIRALNRFIAWAQENTGVLVLVTVLVVVAVGGALYWRSYQQNLEERASAELSTLQTRIAQQARQGAPALAVTDSLQAFLQRFDGTSSAREARILLARQQIGEGRPSQAVEAIRPVVDGTRPDTPTGFAARSLLADAQTAAGDTAAAISTLDGLAREARFSFQRRDAAADRASLLAATGRLEEARDIYRRLAEEASGTEAGELYAVRLGELEARLAADGRDAAGSPSDTAAG